MGEKSDQMCQSLVRAGLWQCLQGAGCRRSSSGGLLLSYFYQRPAHAGFLLSTETTTSLSLAAIALHLLEVGQHEREAGFNRRQMAGKGDGGGWTLFVDMRDAPWSVSGW